LSDRSEAQVYENQRILVLGGPKQARDLVVNRDRFELCAKKEFFDEAFAGFGYATSEITPSLSYFLGLIKGCKVRGSKITCVTKHVNKTRDIINVFVSVHKDLGIKWEKLFWSQKGRKAVVVSQRLVNSLEDKYPDWRGVPITVRTSTLQCLKMYALGLIDAFSSIDNEKTIISTSEPATVVRRFLLSVLSLFGIWPESLKYIHSQGFAYVYITVSKDVQESLLQNRRLPLRKGTRFPYLRYTYLSPKLPIYNVKIDGLNWSLCNDFLLLKG